MLHIFGEIKKQKQTKTERNMNIGWYYQDFWIVVGHLNFGNTC